MKNIEIIEDVLNDIKHTTNQLKGMIDNLEHHLQQATKVEKKKCYRVKDEYSFRDLMGKLEKEGYVWSGGRIKPTFYDYDNGREFIYIVNGELQSSDYDWYKSYEEKRCYLEEYLVEEPRFYAKIKGTEIYMNHIDYTWGGFTTIEGRAINMTKTEWNELGINDTNANFEEVAE